MSDTLLEHFKISSIRCEFDKVLCRLPPSALGRRVFAAATSKDRRPQVKLLCSFHELPNDPSVVSDCRLNRQIRELPLKREHEVADGIAKSGRGW